MFYGYAILNIPIDTHAMSEIGSVGTAEVNGLRIGITADTHIPRRAKLLPVNMLKDLANTDLIIHAGDIQDIAVIELLKTLAPVEAVAGNVDPPELQELLGRKKVLQLAGFTIGITHGAGQRGTTIKRAMEVFGAEQPHCIIFGHSHQPVIEWINGTLLLNPGSPTDRRRQPWPSYAILEVTDILTPRIIYLDTTA